MHLIFKKIIINNFMSIGHGEVDLTNQGYVLINGINNNPNDSAKSNGSGKSSIIESIVYCLTGETIRNTRDIVNRYTSDGCKVELTFSVNNDEYRLIRSKDDKELGTNLKIFFNNKDISGKGIRDSEKILEEYLPDLTSSLIGSVIVLGQGLPQRFTNNTPAGRKEVLEKLSKSDYMIEDIKNKLSERKSQLNEELRIIEDSILSNNSKKQLLNNQLQKLKLDKETLIPIDFDSELSQYNNELEKLLDYQTETFHYSNQLNTLLDDKIKEYQQYSSKVNADFEKEKTLLQESIEPYYTKLNSLRVELNLKEKEITKLESIVDVCPTCGQHLPDVHKVDTTDLKKEKDILINNLNEAEITYDNEKRKIENKLATIRKSFDDDAEKIKQEGKELRETFNSVNDDLQKYNNDINNLKLEINKLNLKKETYEKQSKTIDSDINRVEQDIKTLEELVTTKTSEKTTLEDRLSIIAKMTTIATRDFRGFLLSEIINYIDKKCKEYSQEIFETDLFTFELDGNNIRISYNNKEYESLSGGEKQKVDLIVQFSIRDMLCQFMNFSTNFIALDEIFDNLDQLGCQNVINMITKKLNDIETIFIITHHADSLDIPYDKEIFIIKDNMGVSKIAE